MPNNSIFCWAIPETAHDEQKDFVPDIASEIFGAHGHPANGKGRNRTQSQLPDRLPRTHRRFTQRRQWLWPTLNTYPLASDRGDLPGIAHRDTKSEDQIATPGTVVDSIST
jgi:hypothetical protein